MCLAEANTELQEIYNTYQTEIGKAADLLKIEGSEAVYLATPMTIMDPSYKSVFSLGTKGLPPQKFFRMWNVIEDLIEQTIDFFDYEEEEKYFDMLKSYGELVEIESNNK